MGKKEIAVSRLPVTPETRLRLKVFAAQKGLTFDKAINFLLDKIEKIKGTEKSEISGTTKRGEKK